MTALPSSAERAVLAAERRHMAAIMALIGDWPEYRAHLALVLLESAVAVCDSFGIDVEASVATLRGHAPMPAVLVPRTGSQS